MIRVENIADEFDLEAIEPKKYTVDAEKLGLVFLKRIFGKVPDSYHMRINELSLTGN